MRAVVVHQFDNPRRMRAEEVPTPEPRGDEVLVAVKAAAINPSDLKNIEGKMHGTTLPRVPGRDFAGIVVKGAAEWMGKRVWGTGGDIGIRRDGSHAEFLLVPSAGVTEIPKNLSMEAAGASALSFVTAWTAMVTAANISSEETAVVIGAGGGVGSAAVQIAKARGAKVIGVVRSDEDVSQAREIGADQVVNSKTSNVVEVIHEWTKKRGADVVFDSSGMMFAEAVEIAAERGRLPIIAAPGDGKVTFNLRSLYRKMLRVTGVDTMKLDAVACAKLLAEMGPLFQAGKLKAAEGKIWALNKAGEAYAEAGKGGERIVLVPGL